MKRTRWGRRLAFAAVIGAAIGFPAACATKLLPPESSAKSEAPATLVKSESIPKSFLPHPAFAYAKGSDDGASIADIAERAAPSVVNVSSSKVVTRASQQMPFFDDPMFRHFFGPGRGPGPGQQGPGEETQKGLGSGVIVSKDGIVLTNNHVIEGADDVQVTTADNREFQAKVVGSDAKSDLAVLKLEGDTSGLEPIKFGDSSRMRLGDVVLAIGNPFGVGQTITMGIVSAKGRANMGIVDYEDFIQTDAAINPGNSGGALVNMEGELIGINTAILSRTGGNMGIGFAIPSNMAKPIMDSLVTDGRVVRGWLGVGIQDLDKDLVAAMKLPNTKGVLVSEVMKNSPADRAGLKQGDVVVSVDGKPVDSAGRLRNLVASAGAEKNVTLEVLRNGEKLLKQVKLGELPNDVAQGPAANPGVPSQGGTLDGLSVETLTDNLRSKYSIEGSVKSGVVVVGISPRSAAAAAGLRPGDVVVEVNRKPVQNVNAFAQAYKSAKGRLLLLINRGGRTLFLVLKQK